MFTEQITRIYGNKSTIAITNQINFSVIGIQYFICMYLTLRLRNHIAIPSGILFRAIK